MEIEERLLNFRKQPNNQTENTKKSESVLVSSRSVQDSKDQNKFSKNSEPEAVLKIKTNNKTNHLEAKEEPNIFRTILKIILWIILFIIFIKLEFGIVYFVVSLLFILFHNTNRISRRGNKLSAYSVFNPNCERIQGTLTPEQVEKSIIGSF